MLKVCHIISGDLWAGAEVMAYHLLKGLKAHDNLSLSAILLNQGRLAEELHKLGITVHLVDESNTSFFNIFLAIRNILKNQPPDVIHSHRYKENTLAYLLSRTFRVTRLVCTQHGMPEVYGVENSFKRQILTRINFFMLSMCFHRVVGVSRDIEKAFVKQYGFKEDKVSVIYNGTDIPNVIQNRENRTTFVIGSSGRLFPVKDYPFMVEIAREICKKFDHIFFELAGEGPEQPKIQSAIQRYGLNGAFELKWHVDDICSFYQGLDLYLNTSIHEGIPMSILEAMSHGLPIIAPNVGGIGEIVTDEKNGYLIDKRNPAVFAEKCIELYDNIELRQKMAKAAREKIVQSFSVEKMVSEYYKLYLNIAGDEG